MTRAQIFNLLFNGGNYAKQYLIKLSHPVAGVLRYVNNNEAVTYGDVNPETYQPANFDYTPPDNKGEGGQLEIDATDNYQVVEWIDKADHRYTLEVVGCLNNGAVQPIRSYRHFYGTVTMGEDNKLQFSPENDGRLNMVFNVYKYDTSLNPGNA